MYNSCFANYVEIVEKKSSQSHVMNCIRLQIMQRNCLHCIYLKDHKPLKFTACVEGHAYFAILHTFREFKKKLIKGTPYFLL